MSASPETLDAPATEAIVYPSSDGMPMADNTKQARWILLLYQNLNALFAAEDNVFVAADNLWYPVLGRPDIRRAPDVYVVFGRPRGDRESYQQWRENDVPLTVVIEIRSPRNDDEEMVARLLFYERYGVEEYYEYDPDTNRLKVYIRNEQVEMLRRRQPEDGFISPRLGIRFDLSTGAEMVVCYPDGRPFVHLAEERQRADREHQLRVRLQQLSRKVRRGEATPDEVAELERLEEADEP